MRGCVDPRGKSHIVPGLSGFFNGDRTLCLPIVALLQDPSHSQPAVSEYRWGCTSCGVVSTREAIAIFPAFLELEILGGFVYWGWHPIFLVCVRQKCRPLMGIYTPRTRGSGSRTNMRLAHGIGVLSPCRVVSTRESSVCFLD